MVRRISKHRNLKYALSTTDTPIAEIQPGETVEVECEINCNAGVITSTASNVSTENVKLPFVNPATGPLSVADASLYIGDNHAIQGDGECVGMGATEVAADITFSTTLAEKPRRLVWPRLENATHIVTLGCARPLEDAMRIAFEQMVYWLADEYRFTETEAYLFLAQVAEARCTQMVNPKYTHICKVAKSFLS